MNKNIIKLPHTISVYKYVPEKHVHNMLKKGKVKIGTLYSYREGKDPERSDSNEGILSLYTEFDEPQTFRGQDELKGVYREMIHMENDTCVVHIGPSTKSILRKEAPDAFIFSCSKNLDKKLEDTLGTPIEITNLFAFGISIAHELNQRGLIEVNKQGNPKVHITSCQYTDPEINYEEGKDMNPYSQKDKEYSHQEEIRFIFPANQTVSQPLESQTIECPDLTQIFKLVE